ncbi:MAG: DUF2490 domain-containing protein [Sphingobacteriaceae bacterium]|nr:DUF2490 domain-containing protein [Cytophagaceae bacterium]
MRILLPVLSLWLSIPGFAQDLSFFGIFPTWSQTGSLSKRWSYNLTLSGTVDAVDRTIEGVSYPATALQWLGQPSVSYKLGSRWQAGLGYAYVRHNLFGRVHTNEHRLWAQTVYAHPAGTTARLTHRFRYEERYPFNQENRRRSWCNLGRYQVAVQVPLYDPKTRKQGLFLSASNEAFFCFNGARNGPIGAKNAFFGEDWVYVGLGYQTRLLGRIEAGYQAQLLRYNPTRDLRTLHLLQVTWSTQFNLLDELAIWFLTPSGG